MSTPSPPLLEMLWESCDPESALKRFGLADAESAAHELSLVLADNWDLRGVTCDRIVFSAGNALAWMRTEAGPRIAKWSVVPSLHPRLAEFTRLNAWLGSRGFPVSAPILSSSGVLRLEAKGISMELQSVIEGEHLDANDAEHVRGAGMLLARLHRELADYPDVARIQQLAANDGAGEGGRGTTYPRAIQPAPLVERITNWLGAAPGHVPALAMEALREQLAGMPRVDLPIQLVHNDVRSANLLCQGSRIVALLDFEDVTLDHCVVDLAHSAVLLGTKFHKWAPVSSDTHTELVADYQSVRPLSATETAWLPVLILWSTLCMIPGENDPADWAGSALSQVRK